MLLSAFAGGGGVAECPALRLCCRVGRGGGRWPWGRGGNRPSALLGQAAGGGWALGPGRFRGSVAALRRRPAARGRCRPHALSACALCELGEAVAAGNSAWPPQGTVGKPGPGPPAAAAPHCRPASIAACTGTGLKLPGLKAPEGCVRLPCPGWAWVGGWSVTAAGRAAV